MLPRETNCDTVSLVSSVNRFLYAKACSLCLNQYVFKEIAQLLPTFQHQEV